AVAVHPGRGDGSAVNAQRRGICRRVSQQYLDSERVGAGGWQHGAYRVRCKRGGPRDAAPEDGSPPPRQSSAENMAPAVHSLLFVAAECIRGTLEIVREEPITLGLRRQGCAACRYGKK